ncbi:MAG: hypothetical protein ACI304_09295 [Lepagella sp.]
MMMRSNGLCIRLLWVVVAIVASVGCAFAQGETIPPQTSTSLPDAKPGDSFPISEEHSLLPRTSFAGKNKNSRKPDPKLSKIINQADKYFDDYSYSAAFDEYTKAVEYVKSNKLYPFFPETVTHVYMRLGKTAYYLGRYTSGMSVVYDLLCLYPDLNAELRVEAFTQLANYFIRLEKYNIAIKYLGDAMTLLKGSKLSADKRHILEADIDIAFSSAYMMKDEVEQSLQYLKQAEKNASPTQMSRIYQNRAISYLAFDNIEKAKEFCDKALSTSSSPYDRAILRNNYASLCAETHDFEKALSLVTENEQEINKIDAIHVKAHLFWVKSKIYKNQGNDRLALEYLEKQSAILDTIFDKNNEEKQMMLSNAFETEKIKNDKTLLEYQLKISEYESFKKTIWIVVIALVCMAVVLLTLLIVKRTRRQKRSLEIEIEHKDADKDAAVNATKREFEEIVSSKSRKLAANTLFMARTNELVEEISDELARLKKHVNTSEGEEILRTIHSHIDALNTDENDWEEFMAHFGEVYPAFYARLNARHPNLTPGDQRMCAFILLNLNSKEIAALTHRSLRTVDTTKYRLRKKLELPEELSTANYLRRFTDESTEEK